MTILAAILLGLACFAGVALTVFTLPGIWLMVLAALLVELWQPQLLTWQAIVGAAVLALLAEIAEFLAGAVGARRAGGSKRAAIGAVVGGVIGALLGTVVLPIPIVGTVLGASVGAGLAAAGLEMTLEGRTFADLKRVGIGAFMGRLFATVIKTVFAMATAALLIAAVSVEGW